MIVEVIYMKRLESGLKLGLWDIGSKKYIEAIYETGKYNPEAQMNCIIDVQIDCGKIVSVKRVIPDKPL